MSKLLCCFLVVVLILVLLIPSWAHERPKVGLVLSGGGAKGFIHIGVLQALDTLQIPVGCIAGTSMGGLIGAFYAMGYSGQEIEQIITRIDWQDVFTDTPPRTELPYFLKKAEGRYQIEFGLDRGKPKPLSGLVFGHKIHLLFSSITFPYENVKDFSDLPIPFRCVAVDLVTGKQVVLKSGSLAKAMRATMSIPTVFSPVEWDEYLLVDGGILNNLPVDVVMDMGADFIIVVDTHTPLKGRQELDSAFEVLKQTITILELSQRKLAKENIGIMIHPDLTGYFSGDFYDTNRILEIIEIGKKAARQSFPELIAFREQYFSEKSDVADNGPGAQEVQAKITDILIKGYSAIPYSQIREQLDIYAGDLFDKDGVRERIRCLKDTGFYKEIQYEIIPLSHNEVYLRVQVKEASEPVLSRIKIEGNKHLSETFIFRLLGLKRGDTLNIDILSRKISEMYSLGYFENIDYDIMPLGDFYVDLEIRVKELPLRRLKIGLRYDNYRKIVAAGGLYATNVIIPGLRVENELQFAGLTNVTSRASYPSWTLNLPVYPFFEFHYKSIPTNIFNSSGQQVATYKDRSLSLGPGLGFILAKTFHAELCYIYEHMYLKTDVGPEYSLFFPSRNDQFHKIRFQLDVDTLDDGIYPKNGFHFQFHYEKSLKQLKSDIDYSVTEVFLDFYQTLFYKHSARFYGYYGIGSSNLPVYKFLNQGRPSTFVGMDYDQLRGVRMALVRVDYRYEYKEYLYLKVIGNMAFNVDCGLPEIACDPDYCWGIGVGLMLVTPVGPMEIILSRGSRSFSEPYRAQNLFTFSFGVRL